jgi:hypothetical protein
MKIAYVPSSDGAKRKLEETYPRIGKYFSDLEAKIREAPYEAVEERLLINGIAVPTRKRSVRTGLFSDSLGPSYLSISMSYLVDTANDRIVVVGVYRE